MSGIPNHEAPGHDSALALGAGSAASNKVWQAIQLKADLFDYLCWLDGMQSPEELHGVDRLVTASDGTLCWAKTYAEAARIAMEHDKEIFDAMKTEPPINPGQTPEGRSPGGCL